MAEVALRNFTNVSDAYRRFAEEKSSCRACSLYEIYSTIVQSEGGASSPTYMFIGEGPGGCEVARRRPFVGPAGQRLRAELRKYPKVFNRSNTILSNILPCRPKDNRFPQGDGDWRVADANGWRTVTANFLVRRCIERWLLREIDILKPKVIVLLGAMPLMYLRQEAGITRHRGSWQFLARFCAWSFATYHPSYVIRCERQGNPGVVQQFEEDIATVASYGPDLVLTDNRLHQADIERCKLRPAEILASRL